MQPVVSTNAEPDLIVNAILANSIQCCGHRSGSSARDGNCWTDVLGEIKGFIGRK